MSTLSIPVTQVSASGVTPRGADVDARLDTLVRCVVPAQRGGAPGIDFETVFDLDYGQPVDEPVPAATAPAVARRVRARMPRPAVPASVRLTHRGRVVLVLGFLALALALMVPISGWATASLDGGTPERVRIVEVQPGDTLYDIAADVAEPGQIREMVHHIQELNSLPGAQISEGQKLAVPRG